MKTTNNRNEPTALKASKDDIHDVHDTFFRLVVGADPRIAVEILRPLPSQSLADQLSWDRIEAVPTAQVGVDRKPFGFQTRCCAAGLQTRSVWVSPPACWW